MQLDMVYLVKKASTQEASTEEEPVEKVVKFTKKDVLSRLVSKQVFMTKETHVKNRIK